MKNKTKPYRESRVVVKVLKKPILGGEYTGKRAKDIEP
tara:strand:- start:946 stop:1059 length:114 start_codon:yes stop_codon:yes gene_type:complete